MAKPKLPESFHAELSRLQETHSESRSLASAVATLLWQYGVKPSAHNVRQHAGQGSMATINDELTKWWKSLNERDMARVNNPGVPQDLNDLASRLLGAMWDECMKRANASLEDLRVKAREEVEAAREMAELAQADALRQQQLAQEANERREAVEQSLAVERAAKASALESMESWRQKSEEAHLAMERLRAEHAMEIERLNKKHAAELSEIRSDFKSQLETMRQSLKDAEFQFDEMRKQNMVEMDGLRTRNSELREAASKAAKTLASMQENERAMHRRHNELTAEIIKLSRDNGELAARLVAAETENARLKQALEEQKADAEFSRSEQQGQIDMLRKQLEQLMPMAELRELLQTIKKKPDD